MILSCLHILDHLHLKSILIVFILPLYSMAMWGSHSTACLRCRRQILPMEEVVLQFYPGLFSPTPPPQSGMDQDVSKVNFVYSGSAENPESGSNLSNLSRYINSSKQPTHNGHNGKNSTRPLKSKHIWEPNKDAKVNHFNSMHKSSPSCCEIVLEYVTPPNVTVKGKTYRVVHLRNAFQFIPVAICKPGTTCGYGECVERYRAHWILIYNATQPHTGPPVNFIPLEVPSHCECLNVGKP